MRIVTSLLALCLFLSPMFSFASDAPAVSTGAGNIDLLLDRAISQNLIAGGVVVVGNRDGILATAARGRINDSAEAPAISEHTIFDIASLTKVIATAPAVMKLVEEGKISPSEPVSRYLPEFAGRDDITVFHLLTHTSGLDDVSASGGIGNLIRRAAAERDRPRPGSHFQYADVNFILLGEIVHRVSGETLDNFCKTVLYDPMGTRETMFLPPQELVGDIAPTSGNVGGVVQDPNSRHLGGVAGHAGLFSSAYDLSRFARMVLAGGSIEDKRILSEETLSRMTSPYYCNNGGVKRGLGWDIDSPFSAPKGSYFSAASFGHTGYSGSSIWIDPQQDLFVVMLTRRLDYRDVRSFNNLRRSVSTIAAADFRVPAEEDDSAPSLTTAGIDGRILQAALPAIKAATRKVALSVPSKWRHHKRVERCSPAKSKRMVAKGRSGRRGTNGGVARAETRSHKKKRYVKG